MMVEFVKTGYHNRWGYMPELVIQGTRNFEGQKGRLYYAMGRTTFLAMMIERYCIQKKFLKADGKRKIKKDLSPRRIKVLRILLGMGTKYWTFFRQVLDDKLTLSQLEHKLFWKVI